MKTRATFYNSISNILLYFVTILLGIINRWAVVQILGIEYQGINSLFSNILSMLSIAELGIGTAIIYHLYRPLESHAIDELKSIMSFYKKCYYAIAFVVLFLGVLFIPFLGIFVTENPTEYPLPFIYGWFLLDVVISYLFTFKRSILIADQKNYIITICDICYQVVVKLGQVIILFVTRNFIGYLVIMVICRSIENIIINIITNQKYPFLKDRHVAPIKPEVLSDIKLKVKGAFFHKIGSFVVMGTDNLLISKFLGLTMVGIYSNYYLVINSIQSICSRTLTAATASVGHLLTEHNYEKNRLIFNELLILNGFLVTIGACGIYNVATPFISLIFGENYIISKFVLFILALNMYLQGTRIVYSIFKEAAGILYEDRFVPLIESMINIGASVFFVKFFHLAGIFMGTIASTMLLYSYTFPILVVKKILKISVRKYWKTFLWMLFTVLLSLNISEYMCLIFNSTLGEGYPAIEIILANCILVILAASITYILIFAIWQPESCSLIKRLRKYLLKKDCKD